MVAVKLLCTVVVGLAAIIIYLIIRQTAVKLPNTVIYSVSNYIGGFSSSVWCHYDQTNNKICTFRNLCYLPESRSFIFILTIKSVISGLKTKDDLKTISLSSIGNHNNMFLKLQFLTNSNGSIGSIENFIFIHEPILLISRFKPDNIMHVIHDDILPIYMTYSHLCDGNVEECVFKNRLMFIDDSDGDTNLEWYTMFSFKKPFNLKHTKSVSCFDKIFVGLSRETVWFQYGFNTPQGPVESTSVNSLIINPFVNFILNKFAIENTISSLLNEETISVVLFNRRNNRIIVNENFVINKIQEVIRRVYPNHNKIIKINILDPSQNSSYDILNVVIRSNVLVGMHGSAMIYSLFLPKNAAILELFPFGIQPQFVSSTRALCQLPGIFYNYLSWRNFKENNSITHPERSPLLGGIKHLSLVEQERVRNLKTIPAVQCCHDSSYLYRMFQDTIVDDSFEIFFKQVLINQKEISETGIDVHFDEYIFDFWFYPGAVFNISCHIDKNRSTVVIKWNEPFNIQFQNSLNTYEHVYYVTIKVHSRIVTLETFSHSVSIKLTVEEINSDMLENNVQVWIKTVVKDTEGTDVHSRCTLLN